MISQHPGGLRLTSRAIRKTGLVPPARALDVGCGSGATVTFLNDLGFDATGIDERAEALPFDDNTFDLVLCECVLSILPDAAIALAEARRVLRHNGFLVVSDVYERGSTSLKRLIENSGFTTVLEEDHSRELAAYTREFSLQAYGFCDLKFAKPGYVLYVCRVETPLEAMTSGILLDDSVDTHDEYTDRNISNIMRYVSDYSRFYRNISTDYSSFLSLPFTTSNDISRDPNAFICVSPRDIARCVTLPTSGTTDRSKRIFFTEDDLEQTVNFFDYGMRGIARPNGHTMIFMPGEARGSVGDLLTAGLRRFDCTATVYGTITDVHTTIKALNDSNADCVVGIPAQILALARTGSAPSVRNVLLSADYVPRSAIDAIEYAWNCKVFTHYGMTETGLGAAVQCCERDGMHIRADLYCEIIDENGAVLPDGNVGELVITTLKRRAMPLLRYRTGDQTSILPGDCPCGCMLKRLGRVLSRIGDMITPALDEAVFALPFVRAFDAKLTADNILSVIVNLTDDADKQNALDAVSVAAQRVTGFDVEIREGEIMWRNGSVKRRIRNNT